MSEAVTRLNAALEGRYTIESELGQGGMATVYLARDEKHNRNVALKVLKPELAAVVGAERFLSEIETTANLQHPNILPLFDSGEADGFLFYVMPYVAGETLRERIDREKQLPVDEALGIATAVAGALQAAHEAGVIHRDIKPGNILLSGGQPLVSDFGIALAVGTAGGGRLTETGLSVGTPFYMSPEQATGDQVVGSQTDTYALACVLYEMLIGDPPYVGSTAQAVLGQIIQGEPVSATVKRRSVPANVDGAIRKALEKLPADRFRTVQDFARALADKGFRHGDMALAGVGASPWNRLSVAMTVLAAAFAASTGWLLLTPEPEPVRGVERFAVPFLEGQEPTLGGALRFELSLDGSRLVYQRGAQGGLVVMVRRWDELNATQVRETALGAFPTLSPDGLEIAYQQNGEIRALALAGGPVRTLMTGTRPMWGADGFIYANVDSGTVRVPAAGGAVEVVTRLSGGESRHLVRDVLPGGTRALIMVDQGGWQIGGLDLESGEMTQVAVGLYPSYLPTGHLIYQGVDGSMMAAGFDPDRLELLGTPVAVMDGALSWSIADDGKLFYSAGASGGGEGPQLQLAWATRTGQTSVVDPEWTFSRGSDAATGLGLSPDGRMVAVREFSDGGYDIWIKELDDGVRRRLTFDAAHEKMPVWEPGGENITYLSDRNGNFDVWSRAADGSGQPELILDLEVGLNRVDWSPDGDWMVLWTAQHDILAYRPGEGGEPTPLLAEGHGELDPAVSPDGRWIAYVSDETGVQHVYVRPFPDVEGGRWQVSVASARYPRWSHDGTELYYQDSGQRPSVWVVEYEGTEVFDYGAPTLLFESPPGWTGSGPFAEAYEVAPGDERFIIPVSAASVDGEGVVGPPYVLVNNFFEELNRLVPLD